MLVGHDQNKNSVIAWNAKRGETYACPACEEKLILRQGSVVVHHFAHLANSDCKHGVGESELHLRCKAEIYKALENNPRVSNLKLERFLGEVRPDISFELDATYKVAIEVQLSHIDIDTMADRCEQYDKKNIHLLWVTPLETFPKLVEAPHGEQVEVNLNAWQRTMHGIAYGRIWLWESGDTLRPASWYSNKMCLGERVQILDLQPVERMEWRCKSQNITKIEGTEKYRYGIPKHKMLCFGAERNYEYQSAQYVLGIAK